MNESIIFLASLASLIGLTFFTGGLLLWIRDSKMAFVEDIIGAGSVVIGLSIMIYGSLFAMVGMGI